MLKNLLIFEKTAKFFNKKHANPGFFTKLCIPFLLKYTPLPKNKLFLFSENNFKAKRGVYRMPTKGRIFRLHMKLKMNP